MGTQAARVRGPLAGARHLVPKENRRVQALLPEARPTDAPRHRARLVLKLDV